MKLTYPPISVLWIMALFSWNWRIWLDLLWAMSARARRSQWNKVHLISTNADFSHKPEKLSGSQRTVRNHSDFTLGNVPFTSVFIQSWVHKSLLRYVKRGNTPKWSVDMRRPFSLKSDETKPHSSVLALLRDENLTKDVMNNMKWWKTLKHDILSHALLNTS